jgi:exosortase
VTNFAQKLNAPATSWAPMLLLAALFAGWAALYLPVYLDFAAGAWRRNENAHQPFIMAIAAGVAWNILRESPQRYVASTRAFLVGALVLAAGLALYAIGRRAEATLLLSASQGVTAAGIALSLLGLAGALRLWFPLALGFYLIIWPSWMLEMLTSPLKRLISEWVSAALFAMGLPVSHAGAVISAGSYQLLVADACAGLNSLIALTAVGVVYLYAVKRRSLLVNATVLLSLAPIAIAANIVRVAILVLITHYLGYDAGQSFLHETAGLVMFAAALAGVFLVDALAARLWEKRHARR